MGLDAERSNAYRIAAKPSNFWKAVNGDVKFNVRGSATHLRHRPLTTVELPIHDSLIDVGRACRGRTCDQLIKSQLLYQLS